MKITFIAGGPVMVRVSGFEPEGHQFDSDTGYFKEF